MISLNALRRQTAQVLCLGSHPGIIQSMLDYDYLHGAETASVIGIVAGGGRKQERYFWGESEIELPVWPSLGDIPIAARRQVTMVLNAQSARRVLSATIEALELLPSVRVIAIFAEQTPEIHALKLAELSKQKNVLLIGPASVGLLLPGTCKLGAIGGTRAPQISAAHITASGDTAVISTSGGMVNELIHTVTGAGLGVSFAMSLGGDRFPLTTPAQAFQLAEADQQSKRIVYFGELGGHDEYELAILLQTKKVTKPVLAYVAGTVAELFETPPQFGHAKAMASEESETASAKKAALRDAGATVCDNFAHLASYLQRLPKTTLPEQARQIGERHKHLIASHISGDKQGDVQLLGADLLATVEQHNLASLTLTLLLGRPVTSKKLINFTDYVLRLLMDHGPYVSGAVNTIVAARAGKDLVSSLAAGLLTIGPRFGGAINQAASYWLEGVDIGVDAKTFVQQKTLGGAVIPGIGHKKYRIDLPDPRVKALAKHTVKDGTYATFAREVEKVTTAKKGNLILNVDGMVAAVLLDLLTSELRLTPKELAELVDIEFFNALFVLSRSVGFTAHYLDQRRHDEGLLRLSDQEVLYLE